jgi:integrase
VPEAKTWLLPEQIESMEAAALHESIPGYMQERDATLVRILADTGVRVGEAASLDVSMLSDDRTTLFMPSKIQKGSPPPATVELADATTTQLRRYLRDRWKDTPALLPSRQSDRMSKRSIRRRIKKLAEIADVHPQTVSGERGDPSDVLPHSLRHSVAYRMIRVEQKSLDDVQLKLRHAQRLTTDQVYSHLVPR